MAEQPSAVPAGFAGHIVEVFGDRGRDWLARPAQLPIVNVVALFVIIASIIPVYFAQRLAGGRDDDRAARTIPTAAP